jgi:hypothetical protein
MSKDVVTPDLLGAAPVRVAAVPDDVPRRCEQHRSDADALVQAVAVLLSRARRLFAEALAAAEHCRAEAVENVAGEIETLVAMARALALHADDLHGELRDLVNTSTRLAREGGNSSGDTDGCSADLALAGGQPRLDAGEEALRRLLGCSVLILEDLHATVQEAAPTPRELAAANDLLGCLKSLAASR